MKAPKSTGREEFGADFAERIYRRGAKKGLADVDIVATVTAFTAHSIAQAYRRFLPSMPDETILCGGGANNKTLVEMLHKELPKVKMLSTSDFGISVDAKEAVSFTTGDALKKTMEYVRTFSFDHGLFGDAENKDVVGISFPDGSVLGSKSNIRLRFDGTYMKMAADGKL